MPSPFLLRRRAFTLIELLVVISIIAILATLGFGAGRGAMLRARKVREVAAAKNLITGFVSTPADFNGRYMYGYDATDQQDLVMPDGTHVGGELLHRYPYRLAPYFNWQLQGAILVNSNNRQTGNDSYQISLNPAMGMNIYLVGGELRDANTGINFPTECVQRPGAGGGGHLLVFASAGFDNPTNKQHTDGYFRVNPPKLAGATWVSTTWTPQSKAADYGQVDARYAGQAVCAFLDGSVQSLPVEELRDMRLWSSTAAANNDPNYNPVNTNNGGNGM